MFAPIFYFSASQSKPVFILMIQFDTNRLFEPRFSHLSCLKRHKYFIMHQYSKSDNTIFVKLPLKDFNVNGVTSLCGTKKHRLTVIYNNNHRVRTTLGIAFDRLKQTTTTLISKYSWLLHGEPVSVGPFTLKKYYALILQGLSSNSGLRLVKCIS